MENTERKKNVLFLCIHNSARSQMAEGFLRKLGGDRFNAMSAGLEPTDVNPYAIEVMQEVGIDITGQRAKGLDQFLGKETIHYAIFVCSAAEEKCPHVYTFALNKLSWTFDDPESFEGSEQERLEKFRTVRDGIHLKIEEWLSNFREINVAG